MRAIGFRVRPKSIWYAVVESGDSFDEVLTTEELIVPQALHTPEQLRFIRTAALDLIDEFHVEAAGIRTTEPSSQNLSIFRVNAEGVIQELIGAGRVARFVAGPIGTLSSHLKLKAKNFKEAVANDAPFRNLERWASYSPECREAVLSALAAAHVPAPRFTSLNFPKPADPVTE